MPSCPRLKPCPFFVYYSISCYWNYCNTRNIQMKQTDSYHISFLQKWIYTEKNFFSLLYLLLYFFDQPVQVLTSFFRCRKVNDYCFLQPIFNHSSKPISCVHQPWLENYDNNGFQAVQYGRLKLFEQCACLVVDSFHIVIRQEHHSLPDMASRRHNCFCSV